MLYSDPGWLFAVVEHGLVAAGGEREVEIEIDAPFDVRRRLLDLLTDPDGVEAETLAEVAGTDVAEADDLLDRLGEAGALAGQPDADREPPGIGLRDAIIAAARGEPVGRWVWTAEELLVLPEPAEPPLVRGAVRAFVAGLSADATLRAYCYVATWQEPTTWGDLPALEHWDAGRDRVAGLDPGAVHVVHLATGGVESAPAERIGSLGAARPHRLGTVLAETPAKMPGGLEHHMARHAESNLRRPRPANSRIGRGTDPSPERAGLIARAEAAERYAPGDLGRHELVRARGVDLEGAMAMDELLRFNRRQLEAMPGIEPYDPNEAYLWTRVDAGDRSPAWAVAEAVFFPFSDPERGGSLATSTSSSGVAAHTDRREAVESAVNELIERDAFMWHWVQRVARERIDPRSLPAALRERLAALEADGLEAHLVNLTLDTRPVILCLLVGAQGEIFVGAGCDPDPEHAAAKSLGEGILLAWAATSAAPDPQPTSPEAVRKPLDHAHLHRQPEMVAEHRFLISSPETIGLGEIRGRPGPASEVLVPAGELLIADLSSPATEPFYVVRALVRGIVPISIGYDREPLGMPRLGEPKSIPDGRVLGRRMDLDDAGPLVPHPFA